jgi:hypothetical protein
LNPTSVTVSAQGAGCATTASFSASETGYSGAFTATSNNPTIASVAPGAQAGQFTVTSVTTTNGPGQGGTITVADSSGHTVTEQVIISVCLP